MTHTITLTPPQAAHLKAKLVALQAASLKHQEAEADARELLGFAIAGYAPDGSAFVSVNAETGELIVRPPEA